MSKFKITHKREIIVYSLIICVMIIAAAIAGTHFYRYTRDRLYQESVSQLDEIANHLIEKLEIQLDLQWEYLGKLEDGLEDYDTLTAQELTDIIAHCQRDVGPSDATVLFRAIDSDGRYYTSEGRQGIWTGVDKLSSEQHKQSFLISNWLENEKYMAFTITASKPLYVDGSKITHYVLLRSMEDMKPFFLISAFDNRNLAYIIDIEGTILSQSGSLEGINFTGSNLYANMRNQTYPHEDSFDAILEKGADGTTICTDVVINNNNNNYYLMYNPLPAYEWGMLLLISADEVAVSATQMVTSLTRLFAAVAIGLCILTLTAVTFISKLRRNRKMLELTEENERILTESNHLLSDANARLTAAQKKAEESQKKAEESQKKAEESQKKAEEAQKVAEEAQKEAEESQKIAEDAQKEAEAALAVAESATKAKSQFLANMSHDIRTPMNAIVGVTKLMEHDVENPDKLRYYINKLNGSGRHMLSLINDILDMSKIESGEMHLTLEPIKLAEQVGQVESIIRSQSNEKKQTFTVTTTDISHEYLIGDAIRMRQLFLNLLNNAVKYTQEGGDIRLEISELICDIPGHARIFTSVIDNGFGMTPEFLEHIFEPFTRAEDSTTNKIQGTGLGMSIVKSIVDLMGGTITVESEVGKGSRFDVTLTIPIDTDIVPEPSFADVLLVTGDEAFARNIRAAFTDKPVKLSVAESAEQAVDSGLISSADVILFDESRHDEVPVLREHASASAMLLCCFLSHVDYAHDTVKDMGADGYVIRPFFFENLMTAVDNVREMSGEGTQESGSILRGKRFLCAEDNELNSEVLEALLDMYDAKCTIYPDGEKIVKAFESVKEGDYDAILMDVQMPNMNGMDATRAIRMSSNPLGRTFPIIAMTANAFSSDVKDCLDAGMDAHLAKPIDIPELERILTELLKS